MENWIRIENRKTWVVDKIESYHPYGPRYLTYWKELKRRCIEGFWGTDFGKYRFMPGNLYFYVNFGVILDADKKTKTRRKIKPVLRDLDWELAYGLLEASGFSGFIDDDEYTSNNLWFDYDAGRIPANHSDVNWNLFNKEGELKKYISPRQNIRKLHEEVKGPPLYENDARNFMVLGSRGGGKSYYISIAEVLHGLVFDGTKYYTEESILNPNTVHICVGSGDTDKSGDFLTKVQACMNEFALNKDLGVFGEQGDTNYMPIPFYKDMTGPISAGNKDKKGWRHNYKKMVNGRWVDGHGTQSAIYHVSYSANKKTGAEAAAGGRYIISVIEETGLTELVRQVYNSNVATVTVDGLYQFGKQIFLGTSGNIELIQPSKEMFTNPTDYNLVEYDDIWEHTGKIGFFLPAYMTDLSSKDENGNTDIQKAKLKFEKRREAAAKSKNPLKLRLEKMNYPMKPSDMWVSDRGYYLPYEEAALRERELMGNDLYSRIGTPMKLVWDSMSENGVKAMPNTDARVFWEWPIPSDMDDYDSSIVIYEPPQYIDGVIPTDMYIVTHDPYVSDDLAEGGSIGVTHVWMSPKYSAYGFNGGSLVATYIAKPKGGKKIYYEHQEKLLAYYGNPYQGLWYEANRGEYCRGYYISKNKVHLLAPRPNKEKGASMYDSRVAQFGVMVGNRTSKIAMLDDTYDYLLSNITFNGKELKMIETFPCIFTLRQIMGYDIEGNFDAISSIILFPLAVRERMHLIEQERKKREKRNVLASISANPNIFADIKRNKLIERLNKQDSNEQVQNDEWARLRRNY